MLSTNAKVERRALEIYSFKHADFFLTFFVSSLYHSTSFYFAYCSKFSPLGPVPQENYLPSYEGLGRWVEIVIVFLCLVGLWDWNQTKLHRHLSPMLLC